MGTWRSAFLCPYSVTRFPPITMMPRLGGQLNRGEPLTSRAASKAFGTTMRYDRARDNLDRHPDCIRAADMSAGTLRRCADLPVLR